MNMRCINIKIELSRKETMESFGSRLKLAPWFESSENPSVQTVGVLHTMVQPRKAQENQMYESVVIFDDSLSVKWLVPLVKTNDTSGGVSKTRHLRLALC